MNAIEGVFKVYEVYAQFCLLFCALLNYILRVKKIFREYEYYSFT